MKSTLLSLIILICSFSVAVAQQVSPKQELRLENHPTENNLFVARMVSKYTKRLTEEWVLFSTVSEIDVKNYNNLVKTKQVLPHGKHLTYYQSGKLFIEENYNSGKRVGEIVAYYETGEIMYKVSSDKYLDGELTQYYKNGNIKRIEHFNNGSLTGKMTEYYPDGNVSCKGKYLNGQKTGNFITFYSNGKTKRKLKYKDGELISEQCFNKKGDKKDCQPLNTEPTYKGGTEALKAAIESIKLDADTYSEDTTIFRITLIIDTLGEARFSSYYFGTNTSLYSSLKNWSEQLSAFTPYYFDGKSQKCKINIAFPVFRNKILWPQEISKYHSFSRDGILQEDISTFFWEFISNIPNHSVYFVVDQMPTFPGGEKALNKFISDNLNYPKAAKSQRIKGIVMVSFIVNPEGKLKSFKLMKGVHPLLDEEAFRIAKLMPDWIPGKSRSQAVSVFYNVSFNFGISNQNNLNSLAKPVRKY